MRIQPLRDYRTPGYPTLEEVRLDRPLLARLPRRWASSPRFATALGMGLMVRTLLSPADDAAAAAQARDTVATRAPDKPERAPAEAETAQRVERMTAVVAPVLAEALEHDGRGSTGCVAVNPPTFIPEDEALELIRAELEKAGLKLEEGVELDHVKAPSNGASSVLDEAGDAGDDALSERAVSNIDRHRQRVKLAPTRFAFDFGNPQRSIYIEYLSRRDYDKWVGSSMSTASSYDFPELAGRVSNAFRERQSDGRVVFGVFFDPLAHAEVPPPDDAALDRRQARLAREQYALAQAKAHAQLDERAREKLARQVHYFVDYLREQGILERPK